MHILRAAPFVLLGSILWVPTGCRRLLEGNQEGLGGSPVPSSPPSTASSSAPSGAAPVSNEPPFSSPPVLSGVPDVATLVERVRPAVVNITVTEDSRVAASPR